MPAERLMGEIEIFRQVCLGILSDQKHWGSCEALQRTPVHVDGLVEPFLNCSGTPSRLH
jgi:hypothetical protein